MGSLICVVVDVVTGSRSLADWGLTLDMSTAGPAENSVESGSAQVEILLIPSE